MLPVEAAPGSRPAGLPAEVTFGATPGGRAVRFVHRAPYDDINSTYEAISAYLDSKGIEVKEASRKNMSSRARTLATRHLTSTSTSSQVARNTRFPPGFPMVPPLPARPRALVFDLDGTLTDPKPGITGSVQYALERLGVRCRAQDELEWVIGPPLAEPFARMLGPGGDVGRGRPALPRALFRHGLFENEVIPGIPELLDNLLDDNSILYVATSKPRVFAQRILDHFGLSRRFVAIHGSELDGTRADKKDLLRFVVDTEALDPASAVMIGDREHDVHRRAERRDAAPSGCAGAMDRTPS